MAYSVIDDAISFDCVAGNTYYVVVEGFGFTFNGWYSYVYYPGLLGLPADPGYCRPEQGGYGSYTLEFLPGDPATSGCIELCDNGADDDGNGLSDCDDPACSDDPFCVAVEDCTNGVDDDGDGDIDCADSECIDDATCCDDDGDGFLDPACGGATDEGTSAYDDDGDGLSEDDGDCDDTDAGIVPGTPEVADGRDQDCNGLVDEGTDAFDDDGDGYTEEGGDCDDGDATVYPLEGCP